MRGKAPIPAEWRTSQLSGAVVVRSHSAHLARQADVAVASALHAASLPTKVEVRRLARGKYSLEPLAGGGRGREVAGGKEWYPAVAAASPNHHRRRLLTTRPRIRL